MRKSVKIIALATLSFLLVLTGCMKNNNEGSPSPSSPSPSSTSSSDSSQSPSNSTPISFSVTLPNYGVDEQSSMISKEWIKLMEEKTGRPVNIKFNYIPASEYDEKVKLMIASNDVTDLFVTPLFYDTTEMSSQGQIIDLRPYENLMPNYMNFINSVNNGISKVTNSEGQMFYLKETARPRFPAGKGMLPGSLPAYRYDLFQQHNIKIPETMDEFYDAAKQLKALYPDKYPINTRWTTSGLRALFYAAHVRDIIFWNGSEYEYGPLTEGYRYAIEFANKLYTEKLLDPEYTIDTDDTIMQKALSGNNFMWLTQWFTAPGDYTRNAGDGKIFAVSLYPDFPKYGKAWQEVTSNSTNEINWATFVISSKAKNVEDLIQFIDLQYSEEVERLLTWGIEGTTYTIGADGNPTFVDSLKTAPDPWVEGNKYGIRASKSYRPGLQFSYDPRAYVDFAATDYTVFNGKYEEVPLEKSKFLAEMPMPDNEYVPVWFDEPALQLTADESQTVAEVMTPIITFVTEEQAKFVSGKSNLADWDKFIDKVKKMGDIDKILQIHNEAAKRVMGK